MENTITLKQYIDFLKEALNKLEDVAIDNPNIELKYYTTQLSIYPNSREDALDLLYLAGTTPTTLINIVSGQLRTAHGTAYVYYKPDTTGETK